MDSLEKYITRNYYQIWTSFCNEPMQMIWIGHDFHFWDYKNYFIVKFEYEQ